MNDGMKLPVLEVKDGSVVANSRDVADYFGKRHYDVLRSIDLLDCSADFTERNFAFSGYIDPTGRSLKSIDMTKDGFTFLAMGFTGGKAARFKEAYIARFNAMEDELRGPRANPSSIEALQYPEDLALRIVAEARRNFSSKAPRELWFLLGLPVVPSMLAENEPPQLTLRLDGTFTASQSLPRAA